jgi:class 3 adenylate cyclase/tetratricopeptide (TPR) repeat protein
LSYLRRGSYSLGICEWSRETNRPSVGAAEVAQLISLAKEAEADGRWLDALDYASQALSADPGQTAAAALVGAARRRLGTVKEAGAELRRITVMAVDMHRSTAIAAQLGPESMRELMLEVYEACVDAVARYEGGVTKYLGDGILALFGHPVAHEDDPRRAVLASLAVLDGVEGRAADWQARFGVPVKVRVGLDSGLVAVGPVDASPWSSEEIAGDPPNVASRVQATAEQMTVRVTDATNELIQGWFETVPVGPVELRNYPEPVALHRVLGPTEAETRLEARAGARPPLLGREAELEALRAGWGRAASGERQAVSLVGEPGVGKSRLVEHLIATATASGGASVTLACSRLHRESALRPVARALGRFFRLSPQERDSDALALDAIRRRLGQLGNRRIATEDAVPIYGWLLGVRSAVDLEPEALRQKTFEAVIDLLEAMAIGSQLLLCVDDADTADPSTVALLRALLARPSAPMLVVLTSRQPLPVELAGSAEVLRLAGLSGEDAGALVRAVAPKIGDEAVERLVAGSDGVPYFLEEQARAAQEAPDGAARAPQELSVFLAARLDELGPGPKRLLGEVAVAGEGVRRDVLERLSEAPAEQLDAQLDELCRRRVLLRRGGPTGEMIGFRHALMREAALEGILESRRAELHRHCAEVLSELGEAASEDLAHHYELAGEAEPAARAWLAAGRTAAASGANTEATGLFRRALGALASLPEGATRAAIELDLQLGIGTALSTLEGYTSPGARAAFERAMALGERLGDTATVFPALWGTSSYWFVLGEHRIDSGLVERMLHIAEQQEDPRFRFEAAFVAGYRRLYLGHFEAAREELLRATRHLGLEPIADLPEDSGIVSRSKLAIVLWFLGEAEESREAAAEALRLVDSLDPATRRGALTAAWVSANLAWRMELDGDSEAAIELADRSAAIAAERLYPTWFAAATLHRSIAQCRLGRLDEGLPTLVAMVDAWRAAGRDHQGRQLHPMLMTPYFAGRLAEARLADGGAEEAARLVDELLAQTARSGERFWDVELLRLRAAAAASRGAPPEAIDADLGAARALASEQGARALAGGLERRGEASAPGDGSIAGSRP